MGAVKQCQVAWASMRPKYGGKSKTSHDAARRTRVRKEMALNL